MALCLYYCPFAPRLDMGPQVSQVGVSSEMTSQEFKFLREGTEDIGRMGFVGVVLNAMDTMSLKEWPSDSMTALPRLS